jgi:hypothetical protein
VRLFLIESQIVDGDNGFTGTNLNPTLLDLQSALAEMQRLREENVCLRYLLQEHGIPIPAAQFTAGIPVTTSALSSPHTPFLKAEQRIALFRSLFHGRDDVYAVRWENADGRSGYVPKADRDWKAYFCAKDEDRKKVDRQTRKFRPLTDEVVRGHLVGDDTVGIYPLLQVAAQLPFQIAEAPALQVLHDTAAQQTIGRHSGSLRTLRKRHACRQTLADQVDQCGIVQQLIDGVEQIVFEQGGLAGQRGIREPGNNERNHLAIFLGEINDER